MNCPGCRYPMSFTEIARGQHWCNRCEAMTLRKLNAGILQASPAACSYFNALPVPEFDPYSYLSAHAGEAMYRGTYAPDLPPDVPRGT